MSNKPFTVEVTSRSVRFTTWGEVPGAAYLQPVDRFSIPIAIWRRLLEKGGPAAGTTTFFDFTPEQLKAHGATD